MATQLTRSAVRIYGTLSALGEGSGDVLESLLPFFDPILRQHNGKKLDPVVIAEAIREAYRWNFNSDLVEAFVPYLVKYGWVVADVENSNSTTYTISLDNNTPEDEGAQTVEDDLHRIATQFKKFSEELSPLTTIPRTVEEFADILVEWLLYVEAFNEKNVESGETFKADESRTLRCVAKTPQTSLLQEEEKFLCARFVKHAIEGDQYMADALARIAAIGLLTEVVQDFVKPTNSVDKTNLVVYLDAPIAMDFLGVSGKLAQEHMVPIIDELIRIGASVRIFGQSITEIQTALKAVLQNPRPKGPTAQALMKQEALRDYVIAVSRDPSSLLEGKGIKVAYRTLDQTPSEHKFFTEEDRRDLYDKIWYPDHPRAREHDTDITTFVLRQRGGKTSQDIFKSHAIVLTRNRLLDQIVRQACSEKFGLSDGTVSPVVHRRVLATAIWLRTGMGTTDLNIPKRMLLAVCEQVLMIRPGVVQAVKRCTDALNDEYKTQQLDLLISQNRSQQALMDKTLGNPNVVTQENFPLIFKEMLHPHLEEERQNSRRKLKKLTDKNKKQLIEANDDIKSMRKRIKQDDEYFMSLINALCFDVEKSLRRKKHIRIAIALFLALTLSIFQFFVDLTLLWRCVSVIITWALVYLTITGGKLFGVNIDEKGALEKLNSTAKLRKLEGKLGQFDVSWNKTGFVVTDRPEPRSYDRADLLS